jgi:mono/diheme cytochrome c family protein
VDIDRASGNGNDDDNADDGAKKGGRGCLFWVVILIILLGGGAITAYVMGTTIFREETPAPGEAFITDIALRTLAIPGDYADLRIPDTDKTPAALAKGKTTFQAECSICHGQGGKGDADLGKLMYPPAADLTADRTNSKSDGQLFWLIAHGINLTGMPAWGTKFNGANTDDDIWSMIAFIRTLRK